MGFWGVLSPSLQCGSDAVTLPWQECPSGIVNEENFKQIYSQFFPQGGEYQSPSLSPYTWVPLWGRWSLSNPHCCLSADSSTYATFLFNAFDTDHDGSVSFEVSCGQRGGDGVQLGQGKHIPPGPWAGVSSVVADV